MHIARSLRWENISESLPREGVAGILNASEVCEDGIKEFLLHPDWWLKPESDRVWLKPPKVMIPRDCWEEVAEGLLNRGVCPVGECFSGRR